MAGPGHSNPYKPSVPPSNARRTGQVRASSPPAGRQPGARIGGGIRVVRSAYSSASNSKTPSQEAGGSTEHGPTPLYRRILFPGIKDKPPRILQTPGTEEVDAQLYTLLALVCRGFVTPWYSKISRDRAFFLEIVRIASHVFRQLELRLVENLETDEYLKPDVPAEKIDKIRLVFQTLPKIFERHILDFQTAKARTKSAYTAGTQGHDGLSSIENYFHSLQPHVAINSVPPNETSPDERLPATINADYVRAAIDALLEQLLPKEDFNAETERSVVREVIVGIILDGVFRKVAQPWFIYGLIAKLLDSEKRTKAAKSEAKKGDHVGEPLYYGSITSQGHWHRLVHFVATLPVLFSQLIAMFGYLSWLFTTSFASSHYKHYASQPEYLSSILYPWSNLVLTALRADEPGRHTVSQLGRTAQTIASTASPLLDRIIVHYLYTRIFTQAFNIKLLVLVQEALFPDGYPAPSVPDPTAEEQIMIKERALRALADALPGDTIALLVKSQDGDEAKFCLAKELLEPFSSHYINLHLYLFLLDTVVANMRPDLVLEK